MTDQEHAEHVGKLAADLNRAIGLATRQGIEVVVSCHSIQTLGFCPEPRLSVELKRAIRAPR